MSVIRRFLAGALAVLIAPPAAFAADCSAESTARRVPLLELYTSEGCDSCPPVDRWVSELPARGSDASRVVVLAFHVDYWDRLGWPDGFAQARFSERQRIANSRNGARFVYTPQLMLNGKDYRRGALRDDFGNRVAELSSTPAKAALRLALARAPERVGVTVTASTQGMEPARAQTWLALCENGLATDVPAGENRGKRLQHDFVVRELAGPFGLTTVKHDFRLRSGWKEGNLGVAAFVTDSRSGEALQAIALRVCR